MARFVQEYNEKFAEVTSVKSAIFKEVMRLQDWLHLIDLSVEQILDTTIPEDRNFVMLRCNLNGRPSLVRVVNNRGEISYVVDFQWDTSEIRERLDSLALILGRTELHL